MSPKTLWTLVSTPLQINEVSFPGSADCGLGDADASSLANKGFRFCCGPGGKMRVIKSPGKKSSTRKRIRPSGSNEPEGQPAASVNGNRILGGNTVTWCGSMLRQPYTLINGDFHVLTTNALNMKTDKLQKVSGQSVQIRGASSRTLFSPGVRVFDPAHHHLVTFGSVTITTVVNPVLVGRDYAVELEIISAGGGGTSPPRVHSGDTALLVRIGSVLIRYNDQNGREQSVFVEPGQSVYIPAGIRYTFGLDHGDPLEIVATRPSDNGSQGILPGNGQGCVRVLNPDLHRGDDTHGIPRRWVVSSEVVGHPIGIGMTFGEVPAESSGHYHWHEVDTAILMLSGRVLVPFFPAGEEDELQTIEARQGDAIAIPANWVHGPCVPFNKPMTYLACRPVGIQD